MQDLPEGPPPDASHVTSLWTRLLVEELVRSGVRLFCLSPGSRSAPLTVAVARHPAARHVMHVDERGAAFAALGYGRATGRPAALVTTSGTAVANALPAVVEASADGVSLLLLTADRPPERRDTGANQTIDQVKLFDPYVRWQFDLPAPTPEIDPAFVLTTADQAVHRARRAPGGPVHLNAMFRKPLEPAPEVALRPPAGLEAWHTSGQPYTRYDGGRPSTEAQAVAALAEDLRDVERGLVVAGGLRTAAEAQSVATLAAQLGWPLLPDVTSQLRLGAHEAPTGIAYADQVLASVAFCERHPPEAVLHLGGRCVSKRLRQYVARRRPEHYVVVNDDPSRLDPEHRVTRRIEAGVQAWSAALAQHLDEKNLNERKAGAWTKSWQAADRRAASVLDRFSEEEALTEPLTARLVSRHLPAGHGLVLASSMPVRDMNRYAVADRPGVPVAANRGASGIDGTVATAAGFAHGLERPVTLLIGDLALLHDLNSLLLVGEAPVTVVAVNNDGGGIFHFLPIARHEGVDEDVFERCFGTPHGRSFEHAARLFDLPYHRPESKAAFVEAYRQASRSGRSALIEVRTERAANRALHERLEEAVATAVKEGGNAFED